MCRKRTKEKWFASLAVKTVSNITDEFAFAYIIGGPNQTVPDGMGVGASGNAVGDANRPSWRCDFGSSRPFSHRLLLPRKWEWVGWWWGRLLYVGLTSSSMIHVTDVEESR